MEFRMLGPLEVIDSHGVIRLQGTKPRALLTVLLLNANRPVSADRLALALWGEDAAPTAVKTVHVHVSRLRKALGDEHVLITTPAGYRLRVRPGELDTERFESLVAEGRRALAAGQPERAAADLRQALGLWRGPPLEDLAHDRFAQSEIARLEEQRHAALEARVQADLAAGRHAELLGELQQLVGASPVRERLAGHLMLALYRCGRQSEALDVYAKTRATLSDEFGLEPGPELRELQRNILHQATSLDLHAGPAAGPLPVAPGARRSGRRDLRRPRRAHRRLGPDLRRGGRWPAPARARARRARHRQDPAGGRVRASRARGWRDRALRAL
jgi:DNA-binding SARP family transcriptional activator